MRFLGTKNNFNYYLRYDNIDFSTVFKPENSKSNVWQLISLGTLNFNKTVKSMDELIIYLQDVTHIQLESDFKKIKRQTKSKHWSITDFYIKLSNDLNRKGILIQPVYLNNNSLNVRPDIIAMDFSDIKGIAFTTKSHLASFYHQKFANKIAMIEARRNLIREIHRIDDTHNLMYDVVIRNQDNETIDSLCGIYGYDLVYCHNDFKLILNHLHQLRELNHKKSKAIDLVFKKHYKASLIKTINDAKRKLKKFNKDNPNL